MTAHCFIHRLCNFTGLRPFPYCSKSQKKKKNENEQMSCRKKIVKNGLVNNDKFADFAVHSVI